MTVRDSAGVTIVESHAPVWTDRDRWLFHPEALTTIGLVDGAQPYLFSALLAGAFDADGNVALVDRQTREVRVFDSLGVHRATFGGAGEGPGELPAFNAAGVETREPCLAAAEGGGWMLFHPVRLRLNWYDPEGRFLRSIYLEESAPPEGVRALPVISPTSGFSPGDCLLPDGRVVWRHQVNTRVQESYEFLEHEAAFWIVSDGEQPRIVTRFPTWRQAVNVGTGGPRGGGLSVTSPFRPIVSGAAASDPLEVFVPDPERWEIDVYDADGRLLRIFRSRIQRHAVTDAMRTEAEGTYSESDGERLRAYRTYFPPPDSLPAILGTGIKWDPAGYLWVPRYREPGRAEGVYRDVFEVFTREGRWVGSVALPDSMNSSNIYAIRDGKMLIRETDELGVQRASIYRVGPPR